MMTFEPFIPDSEHGSDVDIILVYPYTYVGRLTLMGVSLDVHIGGHPDVTGDAPPCLGLYMLDSHAIHLAERLNKRQATATLIHEVCHAVIHLAGWSSSSHPAGSEADIAILASLVSQFGFNAFESFLVQGGAYELLCGQDQPVSD